MLEAYVEEEKRQDDMLNQRTSWAVAHIMNSSGNFKKRIQPSDLYTPTADRVVEAENENENKIVERFESPEQREDYIKNLMQKFGKKEMTDSSQ